MKFTKMHGAGNDYVYIYGLGDSFADLPALARKLSNRNFGVGSDGLILIDPSDKYDFTMRMFNADGSISSMCGNGVRCVGKFVYDHGYTDKTVVDIETDAGLKKLTLFTENDKVKKVTADMGQPELNPTRIPVDYDGDKVINLPFHLSGDNLFHITCVSIGNPHAIMFVDDVNNIELENIGKIMEHHPFFSERTNVEFVEVVNPHELKMRVWERGTGET
ncbi:MAG: diaminopimelate epimerase, partial [Odoribacter sp.]|nr:diaminopimelate epimerase [Odoribacter sp.]